LPRRWTLQSPSHKREVFRRTVTNHIMQSQILCIPNRAGPWIPTRQRYRLSRSQTWKYYDR
jgi:hypothetical protein